MNCFYNIFPTQQNHEEEERTKKEESLRQLEYLREQAQEQAQRNLAHSKDKFGNIDPDHGYYSNFGKSGR
jgi:hypothetical protein